MRAHLLSGAIALALAAGGAAMAQDHSRMKHPPTPTTGPAPESVGAPMPTPDFITAAAQSDMFEVEEGKLAQRMGRSPDVKSFGKMMVTEHTKTTSSLKQAIKGAGMSPPPPPPLRADQQAMIDELRSKTGDDFDRTYVTQQLAAHREALSVHTGYASGGTEPKLKAAAAATAPIVQSHINQLETLSAKMGG